MICADIAANLNRRKQFDYIESEGFSTAVAGEEQAAQGGQGPDAGFGCRDGRELDVVNFHDSAQRRGEQQLAGLSSKCGYICRIDIIICRAAGLAHIQCLPVKRNTATI